MTLHTVMIICRADKMRDSEYFIYSSSEQNGNFAYRIKEGYSHNGFAASEYTYNGLKWFWKSSDKVTTGTETYQDFTLDNVLHTAENYPLEYNELADYAKTEQDNGVLPGLAVQIDNFEDYDTIYVVFPVWWYTMPQAVYSFFDAYDFSGKTIIPASTHAGSYLAGSPATIVELEPMQR